MLVRRRRRRANIEPALGKRPVFARWWQQYGGLAQRGIEGLLTVFAVTTEPSELQTR